MQAKPCPFCGSDNVGVERDGKLFVFCGDCMAIGPDGATRAEAVERWNAAGMVTHPVPLPDGWQVIPEPCVGYSMLDETGRIVSQHPVDSAAWRRAAMEGVHTCT